MIGDPYCILYLAIEEEKLFCLRSIFNEEFEYTFIKAIRVQCLLLCSLDTTVEEKVSYHIYFLHSDTNHMFPVG